MAWPSTSKLNLRSPRLTNGLVYLAAGLVLAGFVTVLLQVPQISAHLRPKLPTATAAAVAPPSTVKPTASDLANYVVPAADPRVIMIPKLGVTAKVELLGVTATNNVAAPSDVYDAGWYNGSSQPGQAGAMLIDGHVTSQTANGVFFHLNQLRPGDTIQVARGDGEVFTYTVVRTQIYAAGDVNMAAVLSPVVAGQPGLNLITCTGPVQSSTDAYTQRLVVFTKQS